MAIFRVFKNGNFTIMSNTHLREKKLSLKAKGLLSEMLSLPENWDYTIKGLVAINKESESAIKSALIELKEFGYLKINKLMPNSTTSGRIEYVYDIYEYPTKKQEGGFQPLEIQPLENQVQINTNKEKLNIINNTKENIKRKKEILDYDWVGEDE